ncbi:hypothetical protein [Actinomadura monticuli]|uniref:Mce-associated membrane protein n=1 Tax=Actinomadura monticuli TaxID=3097367 RepID=A0ABV4QKX9_9ACTN
MTMLGRGKRSASDKKSDKKKPDANADKTTKADKATKADKDVKDIKAIKAEEAAEAARLAEEAAAKAREAARLAQIAADEAAEAEAETEVADEPEKPAKSLEKPKTPRKASEVAPDPENAPEDDSAPSTDASVDSETGDAEDEDDEATEATEAAEEAGDDVGDGDDEPRRSRLGGVSTVIAVLAVLTLALGAATTALYLKVGEQKAAEQAGKEASMASSRAAQKLSSYDYQTLDADLKAASATTTGKLHTDYEKLAQELRTVAVQQGAVSNTTVMKVGVVSATPDKVVTLVYANRSSATKNDKQQRLPEPLRIKMTMVKKDGKWLASELTVIS